VKVKITKYIIENGERKIYVEIMINDVLVVFGFPIPPELTTKEEIITYLKQKVKHAYVCWIKVNPPSTTEEKDPIEELGIDEIIIE